MRPDLALACLALIASSAQADMGRECEPRPLTAQEKEAADRVGERLRKALPPPPAGWSTRDERVDVAAGSCPAEGGGRTIPQPVTVSVLRNYARQDAAAQTAPLKAEPPPPAPAARPEQAARVQALEKQLADLRRQEAAVGQAYREARRAGDSAAQREATEASRKLRAEMAPVARELAELRRAERGERAAAAAARTQAAQGRMEEARANRRTASVSMHTNLRQADTRGARPVSVDGVALALRDGSGGLQLLLGNWQRSGSFSMANIDESLSTSRVQSLRVRIDGNEAATAELLERLDLKALAPLVESSAPASRSARAPAVRDEASTADIALKVGSKDYRSSGPAECKAAAQASIYGIAAAQYSVSQRSGGESLRLTLWQPKDGSPAMLSLHVSSGASRYEVDTVKGGAKRDTKGSGTASLQKSGAGGVFTIDARALSGEAISGKIACSRFGAIHAEGG
jgi:hypothetical protein